MNAEDVRRFQRHELLRQYGEDGQVLPICLKASNAIEALICRIEALEGLINAPHTATFLEAVKLETAHQVERWGTAHDRAKAPADWFWLLGYLSGKALSAAAAGEKHNALHHTISSAAVLANWHAALIGADNSFQPGSSDIQQAVEAAFGPDVEG